MADVDRVRAPDRLARDARDRRRARAVGQHVRVQRRLRDGDARRVSHPRPALPDPLDRLHSGRRRPGPAALRGEPRLGDQGARPGAAERAAADDPRRDGRHQLRHLCHELRGRRRLPRPGPERPLRLAAVAQGPRRGRLSLGDLRLPDLRDDDRAGVVVGLDRVVALLGLGSEGDRGARHVADVRDLSPRPQPAILGRATRRAAR